MNYIDIPCTINGLEEYRDEDGFIDFDKIGVNVIQSDAREKMGTVEKDKYWVRLKDGTKILLKSGLLLDNKETASPYAELIVEELAKQVGLNCAHCDLVKFNGKKGIYSQSILKEGEQLISLNAILDIDNRVEDSFNDITNLEDIIQSFPAFLKSEGLNKEQSYQVVYDILKQLIFQMHTLNADGHTENMSIIRDNEGKIRMSPLYDNEDSLLLNIEEETLEKLAFNELGINDIQKNIYPKIALLPEDIYEDDLLGEDIWEYTYDCINVDISAEEVSDFIYDCQDNLDIGLAIKNVEDRIKAPLPIEVSRCATTAFLSRKNDIEKVMFRGYTPSIDYNRNDPGKDVLT